MGNDEGRASIQERFKSLLDGCRGLGIERTGGFIQNENSRIPENDSSNRHTLSLSALSSMASGAFFTSSS